MPKRPLSSLSESELLTVLDKVDDAVFVDDANGNALWLNHSCEQLYRIKREEIVGKNVRELEQTGVFTPSVARMVIESGEQADAVHKNKDGKRILSRGIPLKDKNGAITLIVTTSRDITELIDLQNELEFVQNTLQGLQDESKFYTSADVVVQSGAMRDVLQLAKRLAELDSTVLITGESGVGKGVIAQLLHENGARKEGPFIQVNCGAIPENLIESELFGYEKGAFTGSSAEGKHGLFESAARGSIFLDEISELPLNLQVKMLQVIQEKSITRVGGVHPLPVDVRIISATNRDLLGLVRSGQFREDLYYRLNVVPIYVPPLRERPEDVTPLIAYFLNRFNIQMNDHKELTHDALAILTTYNWPGNVRELQNIIERLMITTSAAEIKPENIPGFIREYNRNTTGKSTGMPGIGVGDIVGAGVRVSGELKADVDAFEKELLLKASEQYGSTREMAKALGTTQPTIVRKLQKHNITRK
jgi:PAS domain S-box-containing protein